MGVQDNDQQPNNEEIIEQPKIGNGGDRPAGQVESPADEPDIEEVKSLYEDLGIKAPVPTGKAKGRPKTANVRAEDDKKNPSGNSSNGSAKNADNKGKSKDAPDSNSDDDSGNSPDAKGSKNGKDAGQVQDESGEADKGVRDPKSNSKDDSERRGEEDSELGNKPTGQGDDEPSDEEKAQQEAEGKRPGKSNPEVERRMQQLTAEKKAAEQRAAELEQKLQEQARERAQAKIAQEDPEYTIDDFRKVRDNKTGEILDLDPERAELAYRRWKDGYDERASRRDAEANRQVAMQEREGEITRRIMKESADAYDSLAQLMDDYPELVSTSGKFDEDFAREAMPIIHESLEYLPGTEPGNEAGNLPVIVGMKLHPKKILDALKNVGSAKRTLPLNGVNDNVESRSNVAVPHSRSSDPTVNAANELYKELGINKRI